MDQLQERFPIKNQDIWLESNGQFERLDKEDQDWIISCIRSKNFYIEEPKDFKSKGTVTINKKDSVDLSFLFTITKISPKWITIEYWSFIG